MQFQIISQKYSFYITTEQKNKARNVWIYLYAAENLASPEKNITSQHHRLQPLKNSYLINNLVSFKYIPQSANALKHTRYAPRLVMCWYHGSRLKSRKWFMTIGIRETSLIRTCALRTVDCVWDRCNWHFSIKWWSLQNDSELFDLKR